MKIPVFTVAAADDVGPGPTLLYVYGGFNISMQPSFSALRLALLSTLKVRFALACIRGGGEYGEAWHQAGAGHKKQNCLDDVHAVATWLQRADGGLAGPGPRRLAIQGGSNGGLVVLACALQRPSLYGAVVSQVPVADMLRFADFTVGALWCGEYGNARKNEADFHSMRKISPLHNVVAPTSRATQLPSTLITTADHDDRVVPLHSFKVTAELQAVAGGSAHQERPLLIRVETSAGHGAGKPTKKVLDEVADIYAFISHELGKGV